MDHQIMGTTKNMESVETEVY